MPIARIEIVARRHQRIRAAPFAEYSVVHVCAGSKRIRDNTGVVEVPAGSYFAIAAGSLLHIENLPASDGPYRAVCLSVPGENMRYEPSSTPTHGTEEPPGWTTASWATLPPHPALAQAFAHAEQGLHGGLDESLLRHRVAELLAAVALAGFRPRPEHARRTGERVRLLLHTQPARNWLADDVARQLAISTATLRRRLAAEQTSFRVVLEEVRLTYGLALVQGTAKPLKLVASECGYASPSRFSARFRQRFGCPPSDLRD